MVRSRLLKISLISMPGLCLALLLWSSSQRPDISPPSGEPQVSPYPLKITGLSYSTHGDKSTIRIKADELKVNPRKYFIFNVKPFSEATVTNARFEVYLNDTGSSDVDPFASGRHILSVSKGGTSHMKEMGLITRGLIKGFTLAVYRADRLSLVVKAKRAIIDFKRQEVRLAMASIEDKLSNKLIESRSVIWSGKDKAFKIPGAYRTVTSAGRGGGKGIKLDLDCVVSSLS